MEGIRPRVSLEGRKSVVQMSKVVDPYGGHQRAKERGVRREVTGRSMCRASGITVVFRVGT